MRHMWHSWRIVPTIKNWFKRMPSPWYSVHLYILPFCTGLPYSIGPNLELIRILCLLSWLLHQICHFPFDQKVETDSTDTEHVHYWMQLAIFGRDPKSAVGSFLERQEFQFWKKKTPTKQTGLIVLFSTVLAVSAEHTKKKVSGLKMEIIYMGFKSSDKHSLTQKWFHKRSVMHSRPFLVWARMHCTQNNCNPTPLAFSFHLMQQEYSCRSECYFLSQQSGISLGDLILAQYLFQVFLGKEEGEAKPKKWRSLESVQPSSGITWAGGTKPRKK